jgi:hypothetical protein
MYDAIAMDIDSHNKASQMTWWCGYLIRFARMILCILLFLGAFAELRKATVSYGMCLSVRLSVRVEQLGSHWTDFREI